MRHDLIFTALIFFVSAPVIATTVLTMLRKP